MERSGIQDYDFSTRQVGYPVPATGYYCAGYQDATQNKKQFANQRKPVVEVFNNLLIIIIKYFYLQ